MEINSSIGKEFGNFSGKKKLKESEISEKSYQDM